METEGDYSTGSSAPEPDAAQGSTNATLSQSLPFKHSMGESSGYVLADKRLRPMQPGLPSGTGRGSIYLSLIRLEAMSEIAIPVAT